MIQHYRRIKPDMQIFPNNLHGFDAKVLKKKIRIKTLWQV